MAKDYGLKYFKAIEKATLTGIGTSQPTEGGETFNYLEFKTENGSIEKIEVPTFVPNCMCMNFAQGSSGDFYFGFDNGGKWVLIASDIGGEKRIYSDFRIHTLMGAAGCASAVFGAIFFYVAIPLYKNIVLWLIVLYQEKVPERYRGHCCLRPTCSSYGFRMFNSFDFSTAMTLTIRRLFLCHRHGMRELRTHRNQWNNKIN